MEAEIEKYINDVMDLVYKRSDLEQIIFDMSVLGDKIGYKNVIENGGDNAEKRKIAVLSALDCVISADFKQYFVTSLEKNDLWLCEPGHFQLFSNELKSQADKIIYFNVTTAVDLKKEDLRSLSQKMSKKMGSKAIIDLMVDKEILGGAIIKKGNYLFDFSVKTKLNTLCNEWKKSLEEAEQSGA